MRCYGVYLLLALMASGQLIGQGLSGGWIATADFYGTTTYLRMDLTQDAERLTATINGRKLTGSTDGVTLHLIESANKGSLLKADGVLKDGVLIGTASDIDSGDHTHDLIGCIATAANPAQGGPPTTDSGSFGGNMDFNEIGEGATVYLPVANPGALLYIGDAHAAMGDGEINGNALETSMDVEVTVDVIPGKRMPGPRVETATHIISMASKVRLTMRSGTQRTIWLNG
jgi:hypothetical protein